MKISGFSGGIDPEVDVTCPFRLSIFIKKTVSVEELIPKWM